MLHLIQPRFRMIFGEHYYRTVIADLQRTPDSMVVHAYVLLDPDKDNLYHSYTVWWGGGWFPGGSLNYNCCPPGFPLKAMSSLDGGFCSRQMFTSRDLSWFQIGFTLTLIIPNIYYTGTSRYSRYWKYLSDRSYFAPMAFSTSNPLVSITLPAFCAVVSVIVLVVGTLSFAHYLAYIKGGEKLKISQT